VTADVIEVAEFPDVAQRYQVYGVPKTIINEQVNIEGAVPEARFLSLVLDAAGASGPPAEPRPSSGP